MAERSTTARAQVAELVCIDLYQALGEFLRSDPGKAFLDRVRRDPAGFAQRNAAETGLDIAISPDPALRRVNDYLGGQLGERGQLRSLLFGALPDMPERERLAAAQRVSALFAGILRVACYQRMAPQDFTDRLNQLASRPS